MTAPDPVGKNQLTRRLRERHVQLIAIGGTIGVGLFLGSAGAIQKAGPGLLVAYALVGVVIFFIMRALGELLTYRPVAGAFSEYAEEFINPFTGYVTGWTYWLNWVATCMAELTAIGIYMHYWFPQAPQWATALCVLGLLYGSNLLAVRVFGELEFWFAVIKVVTIIFFIVAGLAIIIFHFGELGPTASFSNLWNDGGLFPFGILGLLLTMQIVTFSYTGVEVIAVTAGEAENPLRTLPRATNGVILRILLFYIGALAVVMALMPWRQLSPTVSPFVIVFGKIGLPAAAHIINFVVITAAASSCNTGLYSTGRMLYATACRGHGPQRFAKLNSRHVPAAAIHFSAALMLVGVALNALVPESVFTWVTSVSVTGTFWAWLMIMGAHLRYRKAVAEGRLPAVDFKMPGAPWANWLVIAFIVIVTGLLALDADTRVALYVTPVWFLFLWAVYSRTPAIRNPAIATESA